jgi:hypothetical protein
VTSPFDLPPWMFWTAAVLIGCAVLGLVGGSLRTRRPRAAVPAITFQPLPEGGAGSPSVAGRAAKAPAIVPPAPLAASAPEDGPDQRAEFRRPGNPVLVQIADADQQRSPWNAWVVDRSRRGLLLAVERPLLVGNVYSVRPIQAPPATPWTAIEIRHCSQLDGHWEAGCRFLQLPSVAVVMLFG